MKRKWIGSLVVSSIFTGAVLVGSSTVPAAAQPNVYHLHLNSASAAQNLENTFIDKGNAAKFGWTKKEEDKTTLNLNVKVLSVGDKTTTLQVSGVIKIENAEYKVNYRGDVPKFDDNGQTFYFGPLNGTTQTKGNQDESVLGFYFNPTTNDALITITAGAISSDGIGALYFGEPTQQAETEVQQGWSGMTKMNMDAQAKQQTAEKATANTISPQTVGGEDWRWVGSHYAYYLTDETGDGGTTVPGGSHAASNCVGILDTYEVEFGSGSSTHKSRERMFSNTRAVENYMHNKYGTSGGDVASVTRFNLYFGGSNNVNITEAYPKPATQTTADYWWLAYLGPTASELQTPIELVANSILNPPTPNVSYYQMSDPTTHNQNQWTTYVQYSSFEDKFDYPSTMAVADSDTHNGGYTGDFWYDKVGTNQHSVELAGRIQYGTSNLPYYYTYVWTERMATYNVY